MARRLRRSAGRAGPVVPEQAQVGDAPADREVEELAVGADPGAALLPGAVFGLGLRRWGDGRRRSSRAPSAFWPEPVTDCASRVGTSSVAARGRSGRAPSRPPSRRPASRPGRCRAPIDPDGAFLRQHGLAVACDDLRGAHRDERPPQEAIEALIGEGDRFRRDHGREVRSAAFTDPASNLEDVRGIGVQLQVQLDALAKAL